MGVAMCVIAVCTGGHVADLLTQEVPCYPERSGLALEAGLIIGTVLGIAAMAWADHSPAHRTVLFVLAGTEALAFVACCHRALTLRPAPNRHLRALWAFAEAGVLFYLLACAQWT